MLEITTNHVPRLKLYGYELSPKERAEFSHLDFDGYDALHDFFRYRGQVYDLEGCFLHNEGEFPEYWHGFLGESYFSGMLVRLCADPDYVIVGRYSE